MPLRSHESVTTKNLQNLCFYFCKVTDYPRVLHFLRAIRIPCEGRGKQRGHERSDKRKNTGFLCECVCNRTSTDRPKRRYNSEKATAPPDCAAVTTSDQPVFFHCDQAIHDCCPPLTTAYLHLDTKSWTWHGGNLIPSFLVPHTLFGALDSSAKQARLWQKERIYEWSSVMFLF